MSTTDTTAPFAWREITREQKITFEAMLLRCVVNGNATQAHLRKWMENPDLLQIGEAILRMRTVLEAVAQMESCEVGDCPVCAAKALLAELHAPEPEGVNDL